MPKFMNKIQFIEYFCLEKNRTFLAAIKFPFISKIVNLFNSTLPIVDSEMLFLKFDLDPPTSIDASFDVNIDESLKIGLKIFIRIQFMILYLK